MRRRESTRSLHDLIPGTHWSTCNQGDRIYPSPVCNLPSSRPRGIGRLEVSTLKKRAGLDSRVEDRGIVGRGGYAICTLGLAGAAPIRGAALTLNPS